MAAAVVTVRAVVDPHHRESFFDVEDRLWRDVDALLASPRGGGGPVAGPEVLARWVDRHPEARGVKSLLLRVLLAEDAALRSWALTQAAWVDAWLASSSSSSCQWAPAMLCHPHVTSRFTLAHRLSSIEAVVRACPQLVFHSPSAWYALVETWSHSEVTVATANTTARLVRYLLAHWPALAPQVDLALLRSVAWVDQAAHVRHLWTWMLCHWGLDLPAQSWCVDALLQKGLYDVVGAWWEGRALAAAPVEARALAAAPVEARALAAAPVEARALAAAPVYIAGVLALHRQWTQWEDGGSRAIHHADPSALCQGVRDPAWQDLARRLVIARRPGSSHPWRKEYLRRGWTWTWRFVAVWRRAWWRALRRFRSRRTPAVRCLEDLMRVAWAPRRFMEWCLDIDEQADIQGMEPESMMK